MIPFLLFISSFLINLSLINKGSYHPDTLTFLIQSQKTLATGQIQPYITGYNLPVLLGAFFLKVQGLLGIADPIAAINFISVLFGSLSVFVFYCFCNSILGRLAALLSSLLLMTFPMFLSLSTFGNSQIPALFFLILGLFYIAKQNKFSMIGSIVAFGLLGACRPQDLVFMMLPITYFLSTGLFYGNKKLSSYILYWMFVFLITFLLPIPFLFHDGKAPSLMQVVNLYHAYLSPVQTTSAHVVPMIYFSFRTINNQLGYFPLIICFIGSVFLFNHNNRFLRFLILWFFCAFSFYTIFFHKIMPTERYLLLCIIPLIMLLGHALAKLHDIFKSKVIKVLIILSFLLINFMFIERVFQALYLRHNCAINNDFAHWVKSKTEENSIIIGTDENAFLSFVGRRTVNRPQENEEFIKWLNKAISGGTSVYLLTSFKDDSLLYYLKKNYILVLVGSHSFEWWAHSITDLMISDNQLYRISIP